MKLVKVILTPLLFAVLLLSSGCATLTGFSTGRTVGKQNGEVSLSGTVMQTPDLTVTDTVEIIPNLPLPLVELGVRYGITERFDMGFKANTAANFTLDAKYQFVGDKESPIAMAAGAGVAVLPLSAIGITVVNFQFPLAISFHPTDKIHAYVSGRYVYQFGTQISKFVGNINYTGFNAGILFGDEFKFGLDVGTYRMYGRGGRTGQEFEKRNLVNVGLGMLFSF